MKPPAREGATTTYFLTPDAYIYLENIPKMDLNAEAVKNLERLEHLRKQKLRLETWDRPGDTEVIRNLRRQENIIAMSENTKMRTDIKEVLKYVNEMEPIKIPLDLNFARIAQGAKVSSAVLPSGLKMYPRIDNYEWVIRGNFAVLEDQIG